MLHAKGYVLIKNERCGVKAWDILMGRYDNLKFNVDASRVSDLQELFNNTLEFTKKG